jgi:hypothetical protein
MVRVGCLAKGSAPGALLVAQDDGPPLPARTTLALDEVALAAAIETRQPVVLLFEDNDPWRPLVVGLLQPDPGAALFGALLAQPVKSPPATAAGRPAPPVEARVDGKRVVIEGNDEVTLKCGEASITLRRDGKLILRGSYVETTAKGVNRVRGGAVKIN